MHPDNEPFERPRLLGCLAGFFWLLMLFFTVLLFAAAYASIVYGRAQDEPQLRNLGIWLSLAGLAGTAILCSMVIIAIRLRRLSGKDLWDEQDEKNPDVWTEIPEDKADKSQDLSS